MGFTFYLIRAEVNIKPWAKSMVAIQEGNKMTPWKDRVAYAYWRGNPNVAPTRRDLLTCNVSDQQDWNTRLYINVCFFINSLSPKHLDKLFVLYSFLF